MSSSQQLARRRYSLGEIGDVIAGYSEKHAHDRGRGALRILQARDLAPEGEVRWHRLDPCESKPGAERARLRSGDLLLTARAADPRTIHVVDVPPDVVAGSTFAILRCRPEVVDARFLCWLLDAEGTRRRLRAELRGSAMPFLGVAELKRFAVSLPPLPRQGAIVRVHGLCRRLTELSTRFDRALGQLLESAADLPAS